MFKKNFGSLCVVDIRIPKHYRMGSYSKYLKNEIMGLSLEHRKKYIHKIPLPMLSKKFTRVPKDKKVIVIDYKGKQAPLAVKYLSHKGYTNITWLEGGFSSFKK